MSMSTSIESPLGGEIPGLWLWLGSEWFDLALRRERVAACLPVSVDLVDRDLAVRAGAAVHVLVADDGHGCLPYVSAIAPRGG